MGVNEQDVPDLPISEAHRMISELVRSMQNADKVIHYNQLYEIDGINCVLF